MINLKYPYNNLENSSTEKEVKDHEVYAKALCYRKNP
jgi:hypothetical protein